jgi:hypothetical protein
MAGDAWWSKLLTSWWLGSEREKEKETKLV